MANAMHRKIMDQVQTDIKAIVFAGSGTPSDTNVVVLEVAEEYKKYTTGFPAILITPQGFETFPGTGTIAKDDIGFPVTIVLLDSHEEDQQTQQDDWLRWREQIRDTFINAKLSGITEVLNITIEPDLTVNPAAWRQAGLLVSILVLRVIARVQRGSA